MARYINVDKLSKEVLASWDKDNHHTIEASRVHRQEHHHLMSIIEKQPIADVVPKSEVEYWEEQCFHACMNNGCLDPNIITRLFENAEGHNDPKGAVGTEGEDGFKPSIRYAKAEVAREIFEEIERTLDNYHYSNLLVGEIAPLSYYDAELEDAIAELKKKYTE